MLTKKDLLALSKLRLDDAKLLLKEQRPCSAYYLAGYAIELAIKANISDQFQQGVIPDKGLVNATYSHDLAKLIGLAGLSTILKEEGKRDADFLVNWGIVSQWTEKSRYTFTDQQSATNIINAIIDDEHGVLQWLNRH